jgi:hypothetical protein
MWLDLSDLTVLTEAATELGSGSDDHDLGVYEPRVIAEFLIEGLVLL